MSAKLLMGLSEESEGLEKKIGCMTGIFQVFDRHHLLTGGRINKRLPSGPSGSSSTTCKEECNLGSPKIVLEYNPNKSSKQNQRVSVESPSSKTSYREPKSTHKDFTGGETRVLSVKTSAVKEEVKKENALTHKDSPRPIMSVDLDDPLQILVRLKESRWNVSEAPRFSCDGREISRGKSSTKSSELPRLSLDVKSSNFDPKSKEMDRSSLSPRIPRVVAKLMGLEDLPSSESPICAEGEKNHPIRSETISKQPETAYSRIERRVQELGFSQSNKDLRALKHALDRMQAEGLLYDQQPKPNQNLKPKTFESPMVIVKPAKSMKRSKDLEGLSGLRKLRTSDSESRNKFQAPLSKNSSSKIKIPHVQRSPRPQKLARERNGSPVKKLSSSSPRIKQREFELEKKPRATTRRENANGKPLKPSQAHGGTQQGKRANVMSKREDRNRSLATHAKVMEGDRSMIMDSPLYQHNNQKIQKEDHSSTDSAINLLEQPSPVSVLEAAFYQDDLPLSPVKKISFAEEGNKIEVSSASSLINNTPSTLSSEIHLPKLGTIRNLVEKLIQLGSTDETETHETDRDHVSQVLIAAGLLSNTNVDGLHQDLIFDVVKEILVQKMDFMSNGYQPKTRNVRDMFLELCSEIKRVLVERPNTAILENEDLKFCDELMRQSKGWEDFGVEVLALVLEIERSIFKDLIDEIVIGEACSGLLPKGNKRRKQLFS